MAPVEPDETERRQRVAAYAVILRDADSTEALILLSRLAPYLAPNEQWTLPGGGIDFGEHPRDAVVREVHEETGLDATVGDLAWIDSARRHTGEVDLHSVRMVFEGWVPPDSPEPHVVEVDGSTVDARWHRVTDVVSGAVPTVAMVRLALAASRPVAVQRVSAYAVVRRDDALLLTRLATPPRPGAWHLPGGGVEHGEAPVEAVRREVREETGLEVRVGELLGVHDTHFTGTAPSGRTEDFHGIHLVYRGEVEPTAVPRAAPDDAATDDVAWVPLEDIRSGAVDALDVVHQAVAWQA